MPIGPGKYDAECKLMREGTQANGVMLLVFGGNKGSGFSAQFDQPLGPSVVGVLRAVADQIERDLALVTH